MTDDGNTSALNRTLAGMLAELEDEHTRLVGEHDAAIRHADAIGRELERVEAIRAAMVGTPPAPKRPPSGHKVQRKATERTRTILDYARGHGGTFTGAEAAEVAGVHAQGIGPVLAGMVRRGEVTVTVPDDGGPRVYRVAS